MAEDSRKVRVEEQIKVKIGEAKNLVSRSCGSNSSTGSRDVYCTIALDQEEIFRTTIIERTLSPFFGEEYQFQIPRTFRYLSVYLWDRDRHLRQNKAIGKIAIRREELHSYNHKDHWFSLQAVDADTEVQGMANLQISVENNRLFLQRFDESDQSSNKKAESNCMHKGIGFNTIESMQKSDTVGTKKTVRANARELKFHDTDYPTHSLSLCRNDSHNRLAIKLSECVDLAKKNGACDPYVVFTGLYSNKRKIVKRTTVKKKTINPHFDEIVHFDLTTDIGHDKLELNTSYTIHPLSGADLCEVCVSVWHDMPGRAEDIFLGEIKIPVRGRQQITGLHANAWYFLQPRANHSVPARSCTTPPGTRLSCDNSLGSLRLKLAYTADHVFPLATYDQLMDVLIASVTSSKPVTSSAVYILGEITSSKTDLAQPLVRIFTYKNLIVPIIKLLADHEISRLTDPTTIFRGNTLVSKMMDEAMRLSGLQYLHNTLRPILEIIVQEKKPCEIDPTRVKDISVVDSNIVNLAEYVERVFEAITKSAIKCPRVLCQIFHDLRECAARYFPLNKEVRYSVVSGFIFLRFFAPAILGPKLFDLTSEVLDNQTCRTLTLISKTLQAIGNLVSSRTSHQSFKEEYTERLYKKFCTQMHIDAVKHFLEVVSTVGAHNDDILEPVLLKDGIMAKRAQNQKRFGRRNFKNRYFKLTTDSFSYARSKSKRPICNIPLSEILAVERISGQKFKLQNMFQIIKKDQLLYIQSSNCVEEKEWFDLLNKICQSNAARSKIFHPCAFINGVWTCCSQKDENANGCTKVSCKPFQMELLTTLDPARDLQRLHTLIMAHLSRLQSILEQEKVSACEVSSENGITCRQTLCQLMDTAYELEQVQNTYKQLLLRQIKYGSQQAPIGDDSYLLRNGLGDSLQHSISIMIR